MPGSDTNGTPSARTNKRRRPWKAKFVKALESEGTVCRACAVAGISRTQAYRARQQDEEFALAWADAEERVTDDLEQEGVRRALEGSDRLIEFFLKARRPDKYRDGVKVEHSGKVEHSLGLEALTDEQLLARLQTVE